MTSTLETVIDFDRLVKMLPQDNAAYQRAVPFPHAILDDFLPEESLAVLLKAYPKPADIQDWREGKANFADGEVKQSMKLGYSKEFNLAGSLRQFMHEMNSGRTLQFFESLTGIKDLIPDPHFSGGGIHQSLPGAILALHTDFIKGRGTALDRRLNVILFLNEQWDESWGGELELWDEALTACQQSILPIGNRLVVFSTTASSFHGMPHVLRCPEGLTRKSIAFYYYTNGRPAEEMSGDGRMVWKELPKKARLS